MSRKQEKASRRMLPEFPPREASLCPRHRAGCRLRRGRRRAVGGAGGRGGGDPRSQSRAEGPRRFQASHPRAARRTVRRDLRLRRGRGGLRAAFAHRPRQYPARAACGRWRRRCARCRAVRRSSSSTGRIRPPLDEGAAKSSRSSTATRSVASIAAASIVAKVTRDAPDEPARRRVSGLRLRAAQGLWHRAARRGAARAWARRRITACRSHRSSPSRVHPRSKSDARTDRTRTARSDGAYRGVARAPGRLRGARRSSCTRRCGRWRASSPIRRRRPRC